MKKDSLSSELLEEAARDFTLEIRRAMERIEVSLPRLLFQEKHTSGHLWWRKTYYTYYKYSEGSMLQVSIYSSETITSLERGK